MRRVFMPIKSVTKEKAPAKMSKPRAPRASKKMVAASAFPEILFDAAPCSFLAPTPPYIWLDYPEEQAHLSASHDYVIRLGVGGEQAVEIAFDGGAWQPCRYAAGFWWYDWSAITPGTHTLVARMQTAEGTWYRTPVRTCHAFA